MHTKLNTRGHGAFSLYYHLVLTTKYRHKCLTAEMLTRMREVVGAVLSDWRCELVEFNGEQDHVHLLRTPRPLDRRPGGRGMRGLVAQKKKAPISRRLEFIPPARFPAE